MNREKFPQQRWSAASSGCWELRWPFGGENPSAAKRAADVLCREESLWRRLKLRIRLAERAAEGHTRLLQAAEGGSGAARPHLSVLSVTSLQPNVPCATAFLSLPCSQMPPVPPPEPERGLWAHPGPSPATGPICAPAPLFGFQPCLGEGDGWQVSRRRWNLGGWHKMSSVIDICVKWQECQGNLHYSSSYQPFLLCHGDNTHLVLGEEATQGLYYHPGSCSLTTVKKYFQVPIALLHNICQRRWQGKKCCNQ